VVKRRNYHFHLVSPGFTLLGKPLHITTLEHRPPILPQNAHLSYVTNHWLSAANRNNHKDLQRFLTSYYKDPPAGLDLQYGTPDQKTPAAPSRAKTRHGITVR
jgi:hypothetical protein